MIETDATSTGRPDNSLGRLLTLTDGVFAIALTLLALDLKLPPHTGSSEQDLVKALGHQADTYGAFLLTFLVIARYWRRHRSLMRSTVRSHPALLRDTLFLLLLIAAMPFPASLLGTYGLKPVCLALYGAFNALATGTLILMSWDVRRLHLADGTPDDAEVYFHTWRGWLNLLAFVLCIPAGFVAGRAGAYVLLLLIVPERILLGRRIFDAFRRRRAAHDAREAAISDRVDQPK